MPARSDGNGLQTDGPTPLAALTPEPTQLGPGYDVVSLMRSTGVIEAHEVADLSVPRTVIPLDRHPLSIWSYLGGTKP